MINTTRRNLITAGAVLPFATVLDLPELVRATAPSPPPNPSASVAWPDKASFVATDVTYFDSGSMHPVSVGARAAIHEYVARRSLDPTASKEGVEDEDVIAKFARLVNADPDEVTYVQSTTTGEQMVLRALGIPQSGGHIVTDTLHFFGSWPLYEEMARQGMQVTWLRPQDGRISLEQLEKAVRKGTKLVAISAVSTFNGFQHDLRAIADIAHQNGARVYADIIHAAGCVPLDLHASGVDFAACASYKWLMGDFGLGFLYVRKDVQKLLPRTNYGYYGMRKFDSHVYPLDPPGDTVVDYEFEDSATGAFALGTHSEVVMAQLNYSLDYIARLGVENIQKHAQTLVQRLKKELPQRGFQLLTPPESTTPLVTCLYPNARKTLAPRLKEAKIRLTTGTNRFRVSVSVFNTMSDVDKLMAALGPAPAS
jgi:selenocysteine lyase/cysteine desulfurase